MKDNSDYKNEIESLISNMTIEEKIGQLFQAIGDEIPAIGSTDLKVDVKSMIKDGQIGSMIQVDEPKKMAEKIKTLQEIASKDSRLGIPVLMCQDVIHGFETVMPIPLAWSCSFDLKKIRECIAVAAKEAAVSGIDLVFSPMVDIVRDPRWGRVCESAGEDPFLGQEIAKAEVLGIRDGGLLSCLKHFLGYGAAEAGRDYNTVEISSTTLYNIYLKPFQAGIEAGADSVMTAFNVCDGIPMVCNKKLLKDLLRKNLGFDGMIISDFGAFHELIAHGVAENDEDAAKKVFESTVDIEMTTICYLSYLKKLIEDNVVSESLLDQSVERILRKKYETGLMDNPFIHINPEKIDEIVFSNQHLDKSEELALESAVLLENNGILPLKKDKKIALIGPYATNPDHAGAWSFSHRKNESITIEQGFSTEGFSSVCVESGSGFDEAIDGGIDRAVALARESDIVVMAVGEKSIISGEACSRQNIVIPDAQGSLIDAVLKTGKPVVMILVTGRPLILTEYKEKMDAILLSWDLGSRAGNAIAKLLSGSVCPSGHLSMSFPYSIGQIPVYYNHLNTGRPAVDKSTNIFESKWIDGPWRPLYPFGYGLSYTEFSLDNISFSNFIDTDKGLDIDMDITNKGEMKADAVVQVYIRDCVASISRPVKELKGFERVNLASLETKHLSINIPIKEFGFYDSDFNFVLEDGHFDIFVGFDSESASLIGSGATLKKER